MTPPRLLIVADDLTGALDSAGEAARLGIGTRVYMSPGALAGARGQAMPPVVAVSTGSRDVGAEAARQAMTAVCQCLPWLRPERVMKKVDSRLKGHVAAEALILAQALGITRVMAAPALPDMGRIQTGGFLSGSGIDTTIPIASFFTGLELTAPDIRSTADMVRAADQPGLPVGARSLAAALVGGLWPAARPAARPFLRGPALFAIGSRDPLTLAQLARLDLPVLLAANGRLPNQARLQAQVLQMVPEPGTTRAPAEAGRDFADGVAALLQRDLPGTLIVSGGETAGAILSCFGVGSLDVLGLALAGIPVAQAVLPDGRKLHIVTKSGGFGDPDTLARLADMVDNHDRARNGIGKPHHGNTA